MAALRGTSSESIAPSPSVVDEVVRRIVDNAQPLRIILFGSAVSNTMNRHSDVDVLVVVPDGTPIRQTAQDLHMHMSGIGVPVDIVVATPSLLRQFGGSRGLVYREALTHGREVYDARRAA